VFREAIWFAVVSTALAVGASAQMPGGVVGGMPMLPAPTANYDALRQALGLTEAQTQQLQDLQKKRQSVTQAGYRELSDKQRQINEALVSPTPDAATIGRLEIEMANLRKQLGSGQSLRDQAMAILNDDQKAKLADLQNALRLQPAANQAVGLGLIGAPPPVVTPVRSAARQ